MYKVSAVGQLSKSGWLVAALLALSICLPVTAQQSDVADSTAAAGSDTSATTSNTQLKGSVEKVELNLERLRDVGLDLKHMLTAAGQLYEEVTLQPVRIITQPEVVGPGIIINIPIGTEPVGPPIPAKKEHVDLSMSQITPVVSMMKQHVDDFVSGRLELEMPDEERSKLQPMLNNWVTLVNNLAEQSQKLQPLTQAPPYNNQAIASLTQAIQQDVKKLDDVRRKIYKVVAKEGKRRTAKKSS